MASTIYPEKFLELNDESAKNLNIVVKISGIDGYFATTQTFKKIRYGEDGIKYGDPGLVYGGLIPRGDVKTLLNLDGSMTISQKVEPEQGRGAVTLLTLSFTDKDGYMSEVISRGPVVDEPLGNKPVQVWLGFKDSSFPEDYLTIMRAYISATTYSPARVSIQLSDPNLKRRGQVFYTPTTKLTASINNSQTSIPVLRTDGFYDQILGPDGFYDPAVKTYIKIDDEFMRYGPSDLGPTSITVTRGQRGTAAQSHSINAEVSNQIEIQDNIINIALKTMLSGWNGDCITDIGVRSLVNTLDPVLGNIPGSILLDEDQDAIQDLGLSAGDYFTISGSTLGNNKTGKITDITSALSRDNRLLLTDQSFVIETPAPGTLKIAFRSQYDTLPVAAGEGMKTFDVDVATHVKIKNQFLSQNENRMRFLITEPVALKTFIESELFLPIGMYSVTRYGRCSCAITKPPIADEKLIILDKTSIKDITNLQITRGLNNRRYFSEVDISYDYTDAGEFANTLAILDTESLSKTDTSTVLPIKSKGIKTDLGATSLINRRGTFLLNRYKNVATEMVLKTNFKTISQIETGDVVGVRDEGFLKILDYSTGKRNIGTQLFEVIKRDIDLKNGDGTVTLLSNIGVQATDRFGTISPSSLVDTGSTTTSIKIKPSFGQLFGSFEYKKWTAYVGLPIFVHNKDYSIVSSDVTFLGVDPADNTRLLCTALGFAPSADMIVEIGKYPNTTNPNDSAFYKLVHCFIDATTTVTSGVDDFNFFVSVGDTAKMNQGQLILIHNTDYSVLSPEVTVTNIDTGTGQITVDKSLGFTPAAGQLVELNGFKDGQFSYRIL